MRSAGNGQEDEHTFTSVFVVVEPQIDKSKDVLPPRSEAHEAECKMPVTRKLYTSKDACRERPHQKVGGKLPFYFVFSYLSSVDTLLKSDRPNHLLIMHM